MSDYIDWSTSLEPQLMEHLLELIRYYPKGSNALRELFKYFQSKSIIIPKYRTLQDIFSKAFSLEEARLNNIISSIPANIKKQLQEVANMINLRFGPNTWKEILEERARRIAEQKESVRLAKIEKAKADKELWADVKAVLAVLGAIIGMIVCIAGAIYYSQ